RRRHSAALAGGTRRHSAVLGGTRRHSATLGGTRWATTVGDDGGRRWATMVVVVFGVRRASTPDIGG
ncbi:MAG: hypothetical protein ACO395_06670, partial [Pontimonas sp.]